MHSLLEYIFKSSIVLVIFYIFYSALLRKEKYFGYIRYFLMFGFLCSFIVPYVRIQNTIWVDKQYNTLIDKTTQLNKISIVESNSSEIIETSINWSYYLTSIYIIGLTICLIHYCLQYWWVKKIISNNSKLKKKSISIIETSKRINPFSFFKTIVYTKNMYTENELNIILTHEKIHCKQLHSVDTIFANIITSLHWFNPFAWLYKKTINQNLEFIADKETINQNVSVSNYQNLMLKAITIQKLNSITNNFHQSLIKKRIIMLHKKSKNKKPWKLISIFPLIILFIFSCNQEDIYREKDNLSNKNEKIAYSSKGNNNYQEFSLPIKTDKLEILSGFGIKKHTIHKTEKMHYGVDIKGEIGTPVHASIEGEVIFTGKKGAYGNLIKIRNSKGYETRFAQLNDIYVKEGDFVKLNSVIGTVGNTGLTKIPHLHYELLVDNEYIDPRESLGFFNKYYIKNSFSKERINNTIQLYNKQNNNALIDLSDIVRNEQNKIIHLSFKSKFANQSRFIKNLTINLENHKEFNFYYDKTENGIIINFIDNSKILITKKSVIGSSDELNLSHEKIGENFIHIINNKIYTQKVLNKYNRIVTSDSIIEVSPKKAVKKYGDIAKDGAIVYYGESIIIR